MSRRATPSRKRPGWLVVLGGYDPGFVEAIKRQVPSCDREWNPALKGWMVHERHAETLAALGVGLPEQRRDD